MTDLQVEAVVEQVKALSLDQQKELRRRLERVLQDKSSMTSEDELECRLLEAGLLSEIKPPITEGAPYRDRKLGKASSRPLSEVIVEERR